MDVDRVVAAENAIARFTFSTFSLAGAGPAAASAVLRHHHVLMRAGWL